VELKVLRASEETGDEEKEAFGSVVVLGTLQVRSILKDISDPK